MNEYLRLIIILVAFDIISKVLANLILPYNQEIGISNPGLYLYLTNNKGVAGALAQEIFNYPYSQYLAKAISSIFLGIFILLIQNKKWKIWVKIITSILIFYLIMYTILFTVIFYKINISTYLTSMMNKLGACIVIFSFFMISKNKYFKFLWSIILAAGIGNLLSHFYPPFMIVDFIQIDFATYLFGFGVLNFSDIYYYFGVVLLIGYSVIYSISKLKHANQKEKKYIV